MWPVLILAGVGIVVTFGGRTAQPVGQALYQANCLNCHQENGQGVGQLIPAINDPQRLAELSAQISCLIRNGIAKQDSVGGYHLMPAHPQLSDIQIMHITNFVLGEWGEKPTPYSLQQVRDQLDTCAAQSLKSNNGS
ncbi:MAG: cytochrome c [Bacteroidota bacterium]